jgi:hypothetical protein
VDLRAVREPSLDAVVGSDGVGSANVERALCSVVGEVRISRIAYRARGQENLYVADAPLNLPEEKSSHGMRRLAVVVPARQL